MSAAASPRPTRALNAVIVALVLVVIGVGGVTATLGPSQAGVSNPSPSTIALAPSAAALPGSADAPDKARGPYQPWPVSFPKLLPGMFMLDDMAPAIRISPQQARQLLPVVLEMGREWRGVHVVEIKVKQQLSDAQRQYITEQKHQVEQGDRIDPVLKSAGALAMGENASVKVALGICRRLQPQPIPSELAAAMKAEQARELQDADFAQKQGEEWLTVFDECTALFYIDKEKPELRPTPKQAAMIAAILEDVVEPLKHVTLNEGRLRQYLQAEQMTFVQEHMTDLYGYRTGMKTVNGGASLAFPGNKETDDKDYHDPLYKETIRFLRARAEEKAP